MKLHNRGLVALVLTLAVTLFAAPHAGAQLSVQAAVGADTRYTDIEQVARAANTTPDHVIALTRPDTTNGEVLAQAAKTRYLHTAITASVFVGFMLLMLFPYIREFVEPHRNEFEERAQSWYEKSWTPTQADGLVMLSIAINNAKRYLPWIAVIIAIATHI